MRLAWALLLGLVAGIALAWWGSRDSADAARGKRERAERAANAAAAGTQPVLYRWRDDAGTLHVTQEPPRGRRYERVPIRPDAAIEVHGDRD